MQLKTLASLLHIPCTQAETLQGVTLDSRQVKPGYLFVALQGQSCDGHQFTQDAQQKGAIAILASHHTPGLVIPQFIVDDPTQALGVIAAHHRKEHRMPLIALTGSNGKTSVKEMIYAILPPPSLATQGNLNNHLGVPLTLLALRPEHQYAVLELGANHIGEIAYTANLAAPDVALINNIGPAHIGEFGSIEAVANAKGEIYQSLTENGIAVVNDDDVFAHHWDSLLKGRTVLRFSQLKASDVYATDIRLDAQQRPTFLLHTPHWHETIQLQTPGKHHISNALAAATCCVAARISAQDIVRGLAQFRGVPGRQTFLKGIAGATIIDDTYNANLRSVLAAIDVLAMQPGKRILVLGDMGELGDYATEHHETVGRTAKSKSLDLLFTYGHATQHTASAFGNHAKHFANQADLIQSLTPLLGPNTTILVKGSRAANMEHIVSALQHSSS